MLKDLGRRMTWSGSILEATKKNLIRKTNPAAAHKMDWRGANWEQEELILQ